MHVHLLCAPPIPKNFKDTGARGVWGPQPRNLVKMMLTLMMLLDDGAAAHEPFPNLMITMILMMMTMIGPIDGPTPKTHSLAESSLTAPHPLTPKDHLVTCPPPKP